MAKLTIAQTGQNEIVIKKSRFITTVARVQDEAAAEDFVQSVRRANRKANHNVWAARLGWPATVERASDDGEPSGTAGAPTLRVLTAQDLSNVVVITTRYFGGIKLGAAGLIRAYTESATSAIAALGVVELVDQTELLVTIDYGRYQSVMNLLQNEAIEPVTSDFMVAVTLHLFLRAEEVATIRAAITELTNGHAQFESGATRVAEVQIEST